MLLIQYQDKYHSCTSEIYISALISPAQRRPWVVDAATSTIIILFPPFLLLFYSLLWSLLDQSLVGVFHTPKYLQEKTDSANVSATSIHHARMTLFARSVKHKCQDHQSHSTTPKAGVRWAPEWHQDQHQRSPIITIVTCSKVTSQKLRSWGSQTPVSRARLLRRSRESMSLWMISFYHFIIIKLLSSYHHHRIIISPAPSNIQHPMSGAWSPASSNEKPAQVLRVLPQSPVPLFQCTHLVTNMYATKPFHAFFSVYQPFAVHVSNFNPSFSAHVIF